MPFKLAQMLWSNADIGGESDPYGAEDNSSSHSGEGNGSGESNSETGSGSKSSVLPLEELTRTSKSQKKKQTPNYWKK